MDSKTEKFIKKAIVCHGDTYSYERVTPGKDYLNSIINAPRVYAADNKIAETKSTIRFG